MATIEDRLQAMLGAQAVRICVLEAEIEKLRGRVVELEEPVAPKLREVGKKD